MKVFVDANVLFSAAYRPVNVQASLLLHGASKGLDLVTCDYAVAETERNLGSKAPAAALEQLHALLTRCRRVPTVVQGAVPPGLPAKDHPIWFSALAAGCDVLLTGDKKDFGHLKHPRLRVVSPGALFDELFG